MAITAGTHLGGYEIRLQIGEGGMGEIYLAQDSQLHRPVALKLLPDDFTRDDDRLRRFQQEACAASVLNHPNTITIYEIGEASDKHYIVTAFIDGASLRERLVGERMGLEHWNWKRTQRRI